MDKFQKQIAAFLKGLTTAQVILLLVGVAVVGATVWGFVWMIGNSDYKPLYTGLAPADAQKLTQDLAAENIGFRISSDGTSVLVPSDQLDKARLQAASQGPLASGRMGFELFDKPNWSGSDFSEKVNYQRALEAELERTIQTMNGVEQVRVHLVLPHESLFTERERPAKAAVVLKLRGTRLSDQTASSIANLVSSAWDDLAPQNVSVITTDGRMPNQSHGQLGEAEAGGGVDLETAMAERVVQVLSPVVGADHVKSSVTIEYDPTSAESTQDLYDPATAAVISSQTSQETAQDLNPAGIPGTATNAPNTPPAGNAADQSTSGQTTQGIHSENKTFAVSHTTKHLVEPAGRFKRIAAAILVDDVISTPGPDGQGKEVRRKRTPEEMKQIEDLAKAALGFDTSRGDQISVQNIAFQIAPAEKLEGPTLTERVRLVSERWTGMLRYVALFGLFLLVYLLVLNPVKKQVLTAFESAAQPALPAGAASQALGSPLSQELPSGNRAGLNAANAIDPQLQRALNMRQQVVSTVKADPESAGRLVQDWLGEGRAS